MIERKEITKILSLSLEKHINPYNDPRVYMAREVTFDYATSHAIRVDYMQFKPLNNTVSGIEKGDFFCFDSKNGHNFLGDYNYYVMPEGVYEQIKAELPYGVGVYVPGRLHHGKDWYDLKSVRKAKRKDREKSLTEMLFMMFRSAARDRKES